MRKWVKNPLDTNRNNKSIYFYYFTCFFFLLLLSFAFGCASVSLRVVFSEEKKETGYFAADFPDIHHLVKMIPGRM